MTKLGPMTGVVAAFDADVGLGEVTADSGERLAFHCTAIADGTMMPRPPMGPTRRRGWNASAA